MSDKIKLSEENKGVLILLCGLMWMLYSLDIIRGNWFTVAASIVIMTYGVMKANLPEKVAKLLGKK